MRKFLVLLFCLWTGWQIVGTGRAQGAEVPVELKANQLKYHEDLGLVEAHGAVVVSVEGFTIQAEQLIVNTHQNIFTAEGQVVFQAETYSAQGHHLTYNLSSETIALHNFKSVVSPSTVAGKIYLSADQVVDQKTRLDGQAGAVTTCDYSHPHYLTKARKIEYYPDDKVVGYNVTFYVNDVPVMWMPYFVFPLNKRRGKMPTLGYNQVEGYFAKTSWDYFINQSANGLFFLDYMEKKGIGYGFEDNYRLDAANHGRLYVYHVEEKDTGNSDWVVKLDHQTRLNPETTFAFGHDSSIIYLVPSGRRDRTINLLKLNYASEHKVNVKFGSLHDRNADYDNYDFSVSHNFEGFSTSYYSSLKRGTDAPHWNYATQRLTHSQKLFDDSLSLSINAPYFNNITSEGNPGDQRFEPSLELKKTDSLPFVGKYVLTYYENWRIDPDQNLFSGDAADQYLEKLPEINLALEGYSFPLIDLSGEMAYGYYHEVKYVDALGQNRSFSNNRTALSLAAAKSFPLEFGNTFLFRESISQYLYGSGDARYQLNEYLGLHTAAGYFSNHLDFNRAYAEGNTPFFFDQQYSFVSYIKEKFRFDYLSKTIWNVSSGYNFRTEVYDNLNTDLTVAPDERLRVVFKGGIDIENQRYLDFTTLLTIKPWERLVCSANQVYDLNHGWLKSANSAVDFTVGNEWQNTWKVRFTNSYDYFTSQFLLRELSVIKDLHCWEAKYSFSEYRREHTFTITLKALPDQPLGWSTGKGFFYEGFDRAFDSIKSDFFKDSPSRI